MTPKRSGSLTSAEASNYTAEVWSRQCTKMLKKSFERNLERYPGIKVGGYNLYSLRIADDTALIAENKEGLQQLLDTIKEDQKEMIEIE